MKIYKSTLLTVLILNLNSVKGQDTIIFENNAALTAKVIEIGIQYVSYKQIVDFTYSINKNRIKYIKYANGFTDTLKISENKIAEYKPHAKIEIRRNTLLYKGKILNDRKLKSLIDSCELPENQAILKSKFLAMKEFKRREGVYTPIGFALGFAIVPASMMYVISNADNYAFTTESKLNIIAGGIIAGAIIRITCHVIHKVSKNKKYNERREIALAYNEME